MKGADETAPAGKSGEAPAGVTADTGGVAVVFDFSAFVDGPKPIGLALVRIVRGLSHHRASPGKFSTAAEP